MRVGVGDGFDPPLDAQEKLAANVDIGAVGADGIAGNDDAFDDLVRVALDKLAIFERARLAFVGIDSHDLGDSGILGHKAPLGSGGKASAAAPTQPRAFDHVNHICGRVLSKRLAHCRIAAVRQIGGNLFRIGAIDIAGKYGLKHKLLFCCSLSAVEGCNSPCYFGLASFANSSSILSGVMCP